MKIQDLLNQSKPLSNGVYCEEGRKLESADWNSRPIENELHGKIGKLEMENKGVQEVFQ